MHVFLKLIKSQVNSAEHDQSLSFIQKGGLRDTVSFNSTLSIIEFVINL